MPTVLCRGRETSWRRFARNKTSQRWTEGKENKSARARGERCPLNRSNKIVVVLVVIQGYWSWSFRLPGWLSQNKAGVNQFSEASRAAGREMSRGVCVCVCVCVCVSLSLSVCLSLSLSDVHTHNDNTHTLHSLNHSLEANSFAVLIFSHFCRWSTIRCWRKKMPFWKESSTHANSK